MPSSACKKCALDRKSTRLNSSHTIMSYAVFCLKKTRRREKECGVGVRQRASHSPRARRASWARRSPRRPPPPTRHYLRVTARPLFFNDTATTEIYTLSLHDALPI